MELKQTKTILDARRGFLMAVLSFGVAGVVLAGIISNYLLYSIPIFTVCVFAIFIIILSIFYDIYINSTYRIFLIGDEIYIYYPTYSSRAGNEFIYYRVDKVQFSTVKGSSIIFDGTVSVKTDGVEREGIKDVKNPEEFFERVFSEEHVYAIQKRFRVSRIFESENELMALLSSKKKS